MIEKKLLSDEQFNYFNSIRFSVTELFKLQTVPLQHIDTLLNTGISKTQLRKMAGNSWTMEVIKHILKSIA